MSSQYDSIQPRPKFNSIPSAEVLVQIQAERSRAKEALGARDVAVQRLAEACNSLRQKSEIIAQLEAQNREHGTRTDGIDSPYLSQGASPLGSPAEKTALIKELEELQAVKTGLLAEVKKLEDELQTNRQKNGELVRLSCSSTSSSSSDLQELKFKLPTALLQNGSATDVIRARNDILAVLPLPAGVPEDALTPIVIPAPFTLYEFLGNASGSLRNSLANFRVFQQLTTSWCIDREEHGYLLCPVFKCNTNPRVATAHRWTPVEVINRMGKPTECFYNKDGKWYYAGIYKQFRMDDLTVKEWEALSNETTQSIVKETLSGRKNTSPQNIYEVSQLYAVGALRVAVVGLQCIGFNAPMYRAILEQANKCAQSGKWRANGGGVGLGNNGNIWNRDISEEMGNLHLGSPSPVGGGRNSSKGSHHGDENMPPEPRAIRAK